MALLTQQNNKLVRKILIGYAMTFLIINLADSLSMIVDGIVVSRGLGPIPLAAIGLADPSFKIASLFSGVLAIGLQALCAQAMTSGDKEKINRLFSTGMAIAFIASLLLSGFGLLFTGTLCRLFGAGNDLELYQYLNSYLKGWFVGIPGYLFFFILSPLVSLDGNKKNITIATFIQSGFNIVGDTLAIYILDLGTYGVGLATGMAYNISSLFLLLNFFNKHSMFKPFSEKPDFSIMPKIINIGLPVITQSICKILTPIFINRTIISIGGSLAMSAISIKASMLGFCVALGNGIAESVGLMAQIFYNEKDALSLKQTFIFSLKILLTLDIALSALIYISSGLISSLFFASSSAQWVLASQIIKFLAISLPINGCNMIMIKYLQAARKMSAVHILTLFHRMLSLTIFTYILGKSFGTIGLFAAVPVSELAVILGYILFIIFTKKQKDFFSSILMIPDNFGYNSENSFSVSISTVEEAVGVSEKIEEFCNRHNVDRRKSYYSARCMEELSTNIILHGFTSDDSKHHCDIRVMLEPNQVVLRIRDDCPYYNIRERYDALKEDDIDAGVWIRLVFSLAKDINYINIFNTNTLIIKM